MLSGKFQYDLIVLTARPRSAPDRAAKKVSDFLRSRSTPKYAGHFAVTRSLIEGLEQQTGISWLYPQDYRWEPARTLHALSGFRTVRAAIKAKRRGLCERLIVGPNIVISPSQKGRLLTAPEIDTIIVPSDWVRQAYEKAEPSLGGRIAIWPCGVDAAYWRPPQQRGRKVLLYDKGREADEAVPVEAVMRAAGYEVLKLRHGTHTQEGYRNALTDSFVCVVVNDGESQGVALAEAWAMDVPTFVRKLARERIPGCQPAPYLTRATGAIWNDFDDLLRLLAGAAEGYRPREWVLANMTDRHAAEALIRIAFPDGTGQSG